LILGPAAALAGISREEVRQRALVSWIHGVTEEIAMREIGPAGVPYLFELLEDPDSRTMTTSWPI
jgi:hypothetical protein